MTTEGRNDVLSYDAHKRTLTLLKDLANSEQGPNVREHSIVSMVGLLKSYVYVTCCLISSAFVNKEMKQDAVSLGAVDAMIWAFGEVSSEGGQLTCIQVCMTPMLRDLSGTGSSVRRSGR